MFLNFLTNLNKHLKSPVEFINRSREVSFDNYWLTGFCEYSCYFDIEYCDKTLMFNISFSVLAFEDIGFFVENLGIGSVIYDEAFKLRGMSLFSITENYLREDCSKGIFFYNSDLVSLIHYFKKYPFLGSKKSVYCLWLFVLNKLNSEAITDSLLFFIKQIRNKFI